MKTGTKKIKAKLNSLLWTGLRKAKSLFVTLSVAYAVLMLVATGYSHIPPYSAGQCLSTPSPTLVIRVDKNHLWQMKSDVSVNQLGEVRQMRVDYKDLEDPNLKPMDCGPWKE